jgi:glycosyltransferase involved in cell wall biosynthesis
MSLRILQLNSARLYVGEAAHTLNLTEALRQAGHEIELGLREGHRTFEVARTRGLNPSGYHMPKGFRPAPNLADLRKLTKTVKEKKIQLIHTHRGQDHWQAAMAVKLYGLKVPVIRTRHVVTPWKNSAFNRWLAKRTAAVVAVSSPVETDVKSNGLFSPEKVRLIPGGIDFSIFSPKGTREATRKELGYAPDETVCVIVARFAKIKGHEFLREAWKHIQANPPKGSKPRLVMIGWGQYREEIIHSGRAMGLKIEYWNPEENADPQPQIARVLEACDIGLLCSLGSEGFSRAVLEYMALGLPVIGTKVGAVPDLVKDGQNGTLIEAGDANVLAAALTQFLTKPKSELKQMGARGREIAEANHSYSVWVKAHEKLYTEILAK